MKLKFTALTFLAAAVCVFAQSTPETADLQKKLLATSTSLFAAYQQMDQELFLSVISPDFLYVSKDGIMSPDQLVGSVQGCSMTSYKVSDPLARRTSADSATLVYRVHQAVSCDGKAEPADLYVTDVFVRKGDGWLISVHTQTAAR